MQNKHGNLKCANCGSFNIEMCVSYDGQDCYSEAGEGSGFVCGVDLVCNDCGRAYPVCRVKNFSDVSEIKVTK